MAAEQIRSLVELSLAAADARAGAIALFSYVDGHRKLWSTLLTGGAEAAMRSEFLRLARDIAATRARPGVWPPADISTILIVSSTIELLSWWLRQRKPLSIEAVTDIYEQRILLSSTHDAVGAREKQRVKKR